MRKIVFIILLAIVFAPVVMARKKVAVVLSGGGAKGTAHIGALKVMEEAGIPIDYIVGTSMGAIVGGLYSIGYTAHQLDSMVNKQDWAFLLSDKLLPDEQTFMQKEQAGMYQLSFPFSIGKGKKFVGGGVINGQNLSNLFTELTVGYNVPLDFNDFPIPFACVATNVVNGEAVIFHQGLLDEAMRASMAIPAVFTPVRMDSMVLVDGGMVNNFPVNIAYEMGADVVIGIDVQSPLLDAAELTGTKEILLQLIGLTGQNLYDENKKRTTLYIHPDVKGFSTASFSKQAIDTLIVNGERATMDKWPELMKLKESIGVGEDYRPMPHGPFTAKYHPRSETSEERKHNFSETFFRHSTLNFGLGFDTEVIGSLLMNATMYLDGKVNSRLALTGLLSKNPLVRANYSVLLKKEQSVNAGFEFRYNDIDIYNKGHRKYNATYRYYRGALSYSNVFNRRLKLEAGLRYEFFDYDSFLYNKESEGTLKVSPEGFFSYFANLDIEGFDQWYFPEKGFRFNAGCSVYTDNLVNYKNHIPIAAFNLSVETVARITDRFAVLPTLYGRVLTGKDIPFSYLNALGGTTFGRYVPQQMPFAGLGHLEVQENSTIVARVKLRQRIGSKNYVSVTGNYGLTENSLLHLTEGKNLWGVAAGYAYNSLFGPLEAQFGFTGITHRLKFYASIGYVF